MNRADKIYSEDQFEKHQMEIDNKLNVFFARLENEVIPVTIRKVVNERENNNERLFNLEKKEIPINFFGKIIHVREVAIWFSFWYSITSLTINALGLLASILKTFKS